MLFSFSFHDIEQLVINLWFGLPFSELLIHDFCPFSILDPLSRYVLETSCWSVLEVVGIACAFCPSVSFVVSFVG